MPSEMKAQPCLRLVSLGNFHKAPLRLFTILGLGLVRMVNATEFFKGLFDMLLTGSLSSCGKVFADMISIGYFYISSLLTCPMPRISNGSYALKFTLARHAEKEAQPNIAQSTTSIKTLRLKVTIDYQHSVHPCSVLDRYFGNFVFLAASEALIWASLAWHSGAEHLGSSPLSDSIIAHD